MIYVLLLFVKGYYAYVFNKIDDDDFKKGNNTNNGDNADDNNNSFKNVYNRSQKDNDTCLDKNDSKEKQFPLFRDQ